MDIEDYYNEKAPYYDGEYTTPFFQVYKAITWENIRKYLPEKGLILDAGGGTGEWAIRLGELGYSVVLTDVSGGMLRQARLKIEEKNIQGITLRKVDIKDMSCFPDETFDMALVEGDPLSYCGDAEKAVGEVYRVLKQGCHCAASVDSTYHWVLKYMALKRWEELEDLLRKGSVAFQDRFEVRSFTPQTLARLFEDAGFKVVRMLGKPVFLSILPRERVADLLKDKKTFERVLDLELDYCDNPYLVGFAGHLEIVAKKE